jgi:hypothetical protein
MDRRFTVALLGLFFAGTVGAQSSVVTATITVLPGHYVVAGRAYNDLYRLEDAVRALRPKDIALDSCGPRETRILAAAAHRFRDLPTRIRFLTISEDDVCSPLIVTAASLGPGSSPTGIDDRAVSEYWASLLPF